jgi:hypothetical protein
MTYSLQTNKKKINSNKFCYYAHNITSFLTKNKKSRIFWLTYGILSAKGNPDSDTH